MFPKSTILFKCSWRFIFFVCQVRLWRRYLAYYSRVIFVPASRALHTFLRFPFYFSGIHISILQHAHFQRFVILDSVRLGFDLPSILSPNTTTPTPTQTNHVSPPSPPPPPLHHNCPPLPPPPSTRPRFLCRRGLRPPLRHPPLLHTHRNRVLRRPENGSGRRILHVRRAIHRYVGFQLCCCCEC